MSKLPAREVERTPLSPRAQATLSVVQVAFPVLAGLATAIWVMNGYLDSQKKAAEARTAELQKPFYEQQLAIYIEAINLVSDIAASTNYDDSWDAKLNKLKATQWVKISLVGPYKDSEQLTRFIRAAEASRETAGASHIATEDLQLRVLVRGECVARTFRSTLSEHWGVKNPTAGLVGGTCE
jgi:hypothetical protein